MQPYKPTHKCYFSIFPEEVNASYVYREIHPWKRTQIKLFLLLCHYKQAILIINAAKSLNLISEDFIWIVGYDEVLYQGLEMPSIAIGLKFENRWIIRYYVISYSVVASRD